MWLAGGRILKLECIDLPDGDSMVTYRNVSDLVHTGEKLRELASTDDLTKLLNRRQFLASLDDEFTRALRFGLPLSVAIIDVDHFKQVNDRHGHPVGDFVLRALAERCRRIIRRDDILGRLGGEEFAAAFIETDMREALSTAERLREEVAAEPFDLGHAKLSVTVSIGVATRQAHETDTNELLWFSPTAPSTPPRPPAAIASSSIAPRKAASIPTPFRGDLCSCAPQAMGRSASSLGRDAGCMTLFPEGNSKVRLTFLSNVVAYVADTHGLAARLIKAPRHQAP